jgi:hypothetical protein
MKGTFLIVIGTSSLSSLLYNFPMNIQENGSQGGGKLSLPYRPVIILSPSYRAYYL